MFVEGRMVRTDVCKREKPGLSSAIIFLDSLLHHSDLTKADARARATPRDARTYSARQQHPKSGKSGSLRELRFISNRPLESVR